MSLPDYVELIDLFSVLSPNDLACGGRVWTYRDRPIVLDDCRPMLDQVGADHSRMVYEVEREWSVELTMHRAWWSANAPRLSFVAAKPAKRGYMP